MSAETVVVMLPDGRALGMGIDEYRAALDLGRDIIAPATPPAPSDDVTDATGMAQRTGVPATWWLEAARRGDVPHIRAGKYVRYRVTDALAALSESRR